MHSPCHFLKGKRAACWAVTQHIPARSHCTAGYMQSHPSFAADCILVQSKMQHANVLAITLLTSYLCLQGAQDSRKSKLWGKMAKLVLQAAKAGGPDPNANARLREVLYHAKIAAVPKDIIERNIKRASDKSQEDFNEVRWPGMIHFHSDSDVT